MNTFRNILKVALSLTVLASTIHAKPQNPDTDWFKDAGYGVFVHWLWDVQNVGGRTNTLGKPAVSLDEWVNGFDTEKFADQMKKAGAGYVMFTMMQRTRYLCAPNATYEKLTGYKRGEATSHRDLVEDLYRSLHKRGIPLMLYWTGDGPRQDKQAAAGMGGWTGKISDAYAQNWADVVAEYSKRYGDKVRGWWVDGCYGHIGYNEKRWGILSAGLKAGNPHAIIALNNPSMTRANSSSDYDDYTTGEVNDFRDIPNDRWRDGKQFHVLSFLGPDWGHPGCKYKLEQLTDYVSKVMKAGGVVTIDVCLYRDGSVDPAQIKLLSQLRPALHAPARFIQSLRAGKKVTVVTLGTSLTGGTWPWPSVMMEWFNRDFPDLVTIHNLGVGASASSHPPGNSGLDMAKKAAALKPDVVFIEFATNDAYLPYKISQADSKKNLNMMIDTILAGNPNAEIILQTMNSVKDKPGSGPHATNRPELAAYSQGYREVAKARGLLLVDNYPNWLKIMTDDLERFDRLVPDRIHPQLEGYRLVLLPALKKIIINETR